MILFKTENGVRLEMEWNDPRLDSRLKFILHAMSDYMFEQFGVNLTITEIYRSDATNREYYKDLDNPPPSTHQYWRAADIRSYDLSDKQIQELLFWVVNQVDYGKEGIFTAKYHTVGMGFHFHVQCNGGLHTMLKKVNQ